MLSRTPYQAIPNTEADHWLNSVNTTAQELSALFTAHAQTEAITMQVEDGMLRMTLTTKTVPTQALGILVGPGDMVHLSRAEFEAAQIISTNQSGTTFQIAQYK